MRYAGNEVALELIQPRLFVPIHENYVNAGKDHQHQHPSLDQDHPVEVHFQQFRRKALGKFSEIAAVFDVPVNPDAYQPNPGNLNPDKNENGME